MKRPVRTVEDCQRLWREAVTRAQAGDRALLRKVHARAIADADASLKRGERWVRALQQLHQAGGIDQAGAWCLIYLLHEPLLWHYEARDPALSELHDRLDAVAESLGWEPAVAMQRAKHMPEPYREAYAAWQARREALDLESLHALEPELARRMGSPEEKTACDASLDAAYEALFGPEGDVDDDPARPSVPLHEEPPFTDEELEGPMRMWRTFLRGGRRIDVSVFLDLMVIEAIRDKARPRPGRLLLTALCRVRDTEEADRDRVWFVLDYALNDFVVARVTDDPLLRDLGRQMRVLERAHHVPLGKRIPPNRMPAEYAALLRTWDQRITHARHGLLLELGEEQMLEAMVHRPVEFETRVQAARRALEDV